VRALLAGCLTALLVGAAGCGGSTASGAGATDAAALVPSDATAFVGLDTDGDSEQWQRMGELLERVGIRDDLLAELGGELSEADVDWERDVRPALGPSTALAFARDNAAPVVLTRPTDRARLDALLERFEPHPATHDLEDGWVAIGEAPDELERFDVVGERGSLADDEAFEAATGDLPDDAAAVFFYRGREQGDRSPNPYGGVLPAEVRTVAGAIEALDDGLRVVGTAQSDVEPQTYEPELLGRIPDGVVAALSFQGSEELLGGLRGDDGALGPFLPGIEQALGVRLQDVLRLLDGEVALYVRPSVGLPEITLAVTTDDEDAASATIDRIAGGLGGTIERREVDGVEERTVQVQGVALTWAAFDGTLLVSTGRTAVRDFRSGEGKLVDDDAFARAADRAGLDTDEETAGVVYADPAQLVSLVSAAGSMFGGGNDVPPEAQRALEALDGLLAHVERDGDVLRFEGFLGIRGS
jgi:hypothetical protein